MHKTIRAFLLISVIIEICDGRFRPLRPPELELELTFSEKVAKVNKAQEKIGSYWPLGVVHYYLNNYDYDYLVGRIVRSVFNYIETVSCVKFVPLINKPDQYEGYSWLHFVNPTKERKCVHAPIYNGDGETLIPFGYNCLQKKEILHTILHGLGLRDEVTHPFRDQYVRILWENIHPEYRSLFRLNTAEVQAKTVSEYDPLSVMHFHDRAFSRNGRATIAPLMPGLLIQPSVELSQLDQLKLRMLFGHECNKREVGELLDTCKIALHNGTKDEQGDNRTKDEQGDNGTKDEQADIVELESGDEGVGNNTVGNGTDKNRGDGKGAIANNTVGNDTDVNGGDGNADVGGGGVGNVADGNGGVGNDVDGNRGVGNNTVGNGGNATESPDKKADGVHDNVDKGHNRRSPPKWW